jgi:ankyrin repeat protein
MMIASGADVNRPSRESEENGIMSSPLHHAIGVGSCPIADLLLMHRADPDRMAGDGSTPLHRAVEKRLAGIVGTLLQHGANPAVPHGVTGRCALFPPA